MNLSSLRTNHGSKHRKKRLGCGESSGRGKTCGKGHKGQKARSGGSIRLGFEGGQMPLARKIPKRGFNNSAFRASVQCFNLGRLPLDLAPGSVVDREFLTSVGLLRGCGDPVKALGSGTVPQGLVFRGISFSASALSKVLSAGGRVE